MVSIHEATIAFGRVTHRRLRPVEHAFDYRVFFVRLPLSRLGGLACRWFSIDRFNLFSLRRADFGRGDFFDLEAWVRGVVARLGVAGADGEIVLQAFPRVLGYAFNPIAFYFCHDRAGMLRAVLCEVNNTFGERHHYLVAPGGGGAIAAGEEMHAEKRLHVSPFCRVEGQYRFRFGGAAPHTWARIDYHDDAGPLLETALFGREEPLAQARLLRAFFAYPLMTFGVIARIHWQAARLWLRRVPWFTKPAPPFEEISR